MPHAKTQYAVVNTNGYYAVQEVVYVGKTSYSNNLYRILQTKQVIECTYNLYQDMQSALERAQELNVAIIKAHKEQITNLQNELNAFSGIIEKFGKRITACDLDIKVLEQWASKRLIKPYQNGTTNN